MCTNSLEVDVAGRPAKVVDNRTISLYLQQFDKTYPMPQWLDNIICGAARVGDSNPSSPLALFAALSQLQYLDYNAAEGFVNRKRVALGDKPYKRRYCFMYLSRMLFAHRGILFHFERVSGMTLQEYVEKL